MNQTDQQDIYLTIYTKIEKEVLELASSIYFTDEQLNVYSTQIADLIIRCSIELESIAKDLSRNNNYEEYNEAGKCFNCLEKHLKLSKKEVVINSPYFHFNKYKDSGFFPFNYVHKSYDDYYSVYCSLKHDRIKNLNKATIYTLIRILGALYMLNIYFLDKEIYLGNSPYETKIVQMSMSNIFNYKIAPCMDNTILDSEMNIEEDSCIYKIIRKESDYAIKVEYEDLFEEKKFLKIVEVNDIFQDYAKSNIEKTISEKELFEIINNNNIESREDFIKRFYNKNKIKNIVSISFEKMKSSYWLKLNKD